MTKRLGELGPFNADDVARAATIVAQCAKRGWRLATAESCTGGLIAALLTEVGGASAVIECGFVTYSNEAKCLLLGVPVDTIGAHGAVSPETAGAMAAGALVRSRATCAVSVTGIAGPGGGSDRKPVGLVHFGLARAYADMTLVERRFGDIGRSAVRKAAVRQALSMFEQALSDAEHEAQAAP